MSDNNAMGIDDAEDDLARDLETKLTGVPKGVVTQSMIAQLRTFTEMLKGVDRDLVAMQKQVGDAIGEIRRRLGSLQ